MGLPERTSPYRPSFPPLPVDCPTKLLELGMTVRRSALVLIGVATLASFAAGWWAGAIAKSKHTQRNVADLPMMGCTALVDPENYHQPEPAQFVSTAATAPDDTYEK